MKKCDNCETENVICWECPGCRQEICVTCADDGGEYCAECEDPDKEKERGDGED